MTLLHNLRYSLRSLRLTPASTALAILTLALGLGVNTAVFSVVYGIMLRPLPYAQPERLLAIWEGSARTERGTVAAANLVNYAAENHSFTAIAGHQLVGLNLTGSGTPD